MHKPYARVHVLDHLKHALWGRIDLVFRPVVMNRDLDVVFLYQLLDLCPYSLRVAR